MKLKIRNRYRCSTILLTIVACSMTFVGLRTTYITNVDAGVQEATGSVITASSAAEPDHQTDAEHRHQNLFERSAAPNDTSVNWDRIQTLAVSNKTSVIGHLPTTKAFLTIGIPSISRINGPTYLLQTLDSVFDAIPLGERPNVKVVVFLADLDAVYNNRTATAILQRHGAHVTSGLLLIVRVSPDYYPPLDGLRRNFGDAPERVRWRSKQVADFCVLFSFSRQLSEYYVQLEDDVQCADGFVAGIRKYVDETSVAGAWAVLEFSELGFIGKLFRSADLDRLARYMMLFYDQQPIDWLLWYFRLSMGQRNVLLRQPTLFQHRGLKSSFKSKKDNLLQDRYFSPVIDVTNMNPKANVWSTMPHHKSHVPQAAYDVVRNSLLNPGYFWATAAVAGDAVHVIFDVECHLSDVFVATGNVDHPTDRLSNGTVELGRTVGVGPDVARSTCADLTTVATFSDGRAFANDLSRTFPGPVRCIKVTVRDGQDQWIVFARIQVTVDVATSLAVNASLSAPI